MAKGILQMYELKDLEMAMTQITQGGSSKRRWQVRR